MDSLKKIIHPRKSSTDHVYDSTDSSPALTHENKLTGSSTGGNVANPFGEPTLGSDGRRSRQASTASAMNGSSATAGAATSSQGVTI